MQRHHHHDQRFGGPEGRRLGGEHSSHMEQRDDHGRFDGRGDRNDIHRSDYGDDRSGYRSNDNARYGGGYQAGASSGEGGSYGGRDWYAGGAGDNRPYAQNYERGERGSQRDYEDRGYRDDRNNAGRDFGGGNRGYGNSDRGGYGATSDRDNGYADNRGYGDNRGYSNFDRGRYNNSGYGNSERSYSNSDRGSSNDRGYGGSGMDDRRDDRNDGRAFGGYEGRARGGNVRSPMQQRDDEGRFAGRDRYEDDRGWPRGRR